MGDRVMSRGSKVTLKKYYLEWGYIHSILVLHKSIINKKEKNAN